VIRGFPRVLYNNAGKSPSSNHDSEMDVDQPEMIEQSVSSAGNKTSRLPSYSSDVSLTAAPRAGNQRLEFGSYEKILRLEHEFTMPIMVNLGRVWVKQTRLVEADEML
jgi:hypothetical protein